MWQPGKESLLKNDTVDEAGATHDHSVLAESLRKAEEEVDDEEEQGNSPQDLMRKKAQDLSKKSLWVMIFYSVVALIALIALICGLAEVVDFDGFFYVIILANLVGSTFGAVGVYLWGTITDQINIFHGENQKFESSIQVLELEKNKLAGDVKEIDATNAKLQTDIEGLNSQLDEFEELKKSLEEIAGDSEDLSSMLDEVSGVFDNTKRTILYNEKAKLMSVYYRTAFEDGADGMTQDEWEDMMMELPTKQRQLLKGVTFQDIAGKDNVVDLQEFQVLIDKALAQVENELIEDGYSHDD